MSAWMAIHRYRQQPVTVVTLDCGHLRWIEGIRDPWSLLGAEATCRATACHDGQPGLRYVTGAGVIR